VRTWRSLCIASSSAVRSPALQTVVLAPAASSFSTTAQCPFTHAQCNAVFPCAFAMFTSCVVKAADSSASRFKHVRA
jgi:hypothetical protein